MAESWKIKKGDKVTVIAGKDKGKSGEILKVIRSERRVLVAGVNMVKRHQAVKPGQPGGVISKEAPLHVSNVMHLDPVSGKPTRVGYKMLDDGRKVRFAKASGELIDR
ncbi:MAG: 50S ribosomal protein L24 [Alphaproteobacteria bacterium 43-37]|nr:MAG: 50S ribosomal protein L24 [Alphaproteobacteria bacterium 43-37]